MENINFEKAGYEFFKRLDISQNEKNKILKKIPFINHKKLIKRFQDFEKGIPAEDELILILSWLGNVDLIHRLEQIQSPLSSKEKYQVPDLLVNFQINGEIKSFLIEVKSKTSLRMNSESNSHYRLNNQKIKFSSKYYSRLKQYSNQVKIPILIAWKNFMGFWTLVDLNSLKKKNSAYHLKFEDSMKENLLDILSGNCMVPISKGLYYKMLVSLEEKKKDGSMLGTIKSFNFYFNDKQIEINDTLFKIFMYSDLEEKQKQKEFEVIFSEKLQYDQTIFLYQILLLYIFFMSKEKKIDFFKLTETENWPITVKQVWQDLLYGQKLGIIKQTMTCKPKINHPSLTK